MRIIFAAGGTGGHINPALAVADELKKRDAQTEILFIGTADKMEAQLVPKAGYAFKTIEIDGIRRSFSPKSIAKNIKSAVKIITSTARSKKILGEFKPDIVIGFGGYVTGPVLRAASKMAIKTAIHESNAFPGVANKILAKSADIVFLRSEKAEEFMQCKNKPVIVGMPVRSQVLSANRDFSRVELSLDSKPMILSTGGSLGAKVFNEAIAKLIIDLHASHECVFIHSYGKNGGFILDKLKENGVDTENNKDIILKEYIYDMPRCLAAADIVINRSGSSTLAEIEAVGAAAILIPSPNVTENHQYHNAMDLVNNKAAIIIEEKDLADGRLTKTVKDLIINKGMREALGANAKKMYIAHAEAKIADFLIKTIEK